jgi:hypothetical protein
MFPNDTPSLAELHARIEALEQAKIGVNDLPLADLIRKIELVGLDSSTIQAIPNVRGGRITVTWPGGSTVSNWSSSPHGMSVNPASVVGSLNDQSGVGICEVEVASNDQVVSIRLITPSFQPSNLVTSPVSWLALA